MDRGLAEVVRAWPSLPAEAREAVLAAVRQGAAFSRPDKRLAFRWNLAGVTNPVLPGFRRSFGLLIEGATGTARHVADYRARKSSRVETILVSDGGGRVRVVWTSSPLWRVGTVYNEKSLIWLDEDGKPI